MTSTAAPWLHTPLRGDYIPPAAEDIHGFAGIGNGDGLGFVGRGGACSSHQTFPFGEGAEQREADEVL